MLDIAVCDDDICFASGLEEMIYGLEHIYAIKFDIDVYRDGCSLIREVKDGRRYDIICLDIRMQEMDGIETARQIREIDRIAELVYVTSYDSYMKDVFEVMPSGFLVKPLDHEEFKKTLCRVLGTVMGQDAYYRFRYKKENYKIPVRDILYFMSDLRKTHIIGEDGRYIEYRKLGDISKIMEKNKGAFVRIHKSYLVNVRHIVKLSYDKVEMSDGEVLLFSSHRRKEVNGQILKLMSVL